MKNKVFCGFSEGMHPNPRELINENHFSNLHPRPEVLKGDLKDDVFRASLVDVHQEQAESVYQDPEQFFENTYRTDGLRTLLRETMGRLTGAAIDGAAKPVRRRTGGRDGDGCGRGGRGMTGLGFSLPSC